MPKPKLFISHASLDSELARALKNEIESVFANGVDVFCASSPGVIQAGDQWLQRIEDYLHSAQAVLVVLTPESVTKPWLWFEIGATWLKGKTGDCRIYPVCVTEDLSSLPSPLDRLQALCLSNPAHLKQLFEALIQQFDFGNLIALQPDNILGAITNYKDRNVIDGVSATKLLTAPIPDVRVTTNSGFVSAIGGYAYFLAIETQNHSPVNVYINSVYIEAKDKSIIYCERDFPSGELWRPRELKPGKSVSFRFQPESISQYLPKGLVCAVAKDEIGRAYRSTQEEFARAIDLLFNYYLKDEDQSDGGKERG